MGLAGSESTDTICVGGLTEHRGADGAISSAQEDVKKWELLVQLLLHCELYARVDTVQMIVTGVNQVWGGCCVINVSPPKPWGVWKVDSAFCSTSFITRFTTTANTGDPIAVPWIYALPSRPGRWPPGKVGEGRRCHPQWGWYCLQEMGHSSNGHRSISTPVYLYPVLIVCCHGNIKKIKWLNCDLYCIKHG